MTAPLKSAFDKSHFSKVTSVSSISRKDTSINTTFLNTVFFTQRGNRDFIVPVAAISGNTELLSNTVLKATEVYTQYGQDRLGHVVIPKVKGHAYSNREGTLFIEESNDMNSWTTVSSLVVKANTLGETEWVHLTKRYFRFRYANGNLQQSGFLLYQSLGAGEEDININHTVPITAVAPFSVQLDKNGFTDDGRLKVQTEGLNLSSLDTQAKTMDIVFHDKTETTAPPSNSWKNGVSRPSNSC